MSKNAHQIYIEHAKRVLTIEAEAITRLLPIIDDNFIDICCRLKQCTGRVVVTGMGKSGHIANKIAATLASTGTPAFFLHPAEASHGDLGMITEQDMVIALSNSGETDEVLAILPIIIRRNIPLVAITGNTKSSLARLATHHILVSVKEEACPLGLAPTASTTAALAMGDAIAITLLEMRGFTPEDFAVSHPGGKLGRRLLLRVEDIMVPFEEMATLRSESSLSDTLLEMTKHPLGILVAVDDNRAVQGVFSEGDLRRTLIQGQKIQELSLAECMTKTPITIDASALAVDAVKLMEDHKITALPVLDQNKQVVGAINMHHLLNARVL